MAGWRKVPDSICTRPALSTSVIGSPCSICGHTNLVHPGKNNPALNGCAICMVLYTELVNQSVTTLTADEIADKLRPDLMLGMGISARDHGYEIVLQRVSREAMDAGVPGGQANIHAYGETLTSALSNVLSKLRSYE